MYRLNSRPWAYYNDFEPSAVEWLRNLIAAGLIADGEVDARSILDVSASDLRGFRQCHFFAGVGGWSYALRLAGWKDEWAVWTGSPPCQPFSNAGRQKGQQDERHLAPHFAELIASGRPPFLFGEQVASAAVFGKAASASKRKASPEPEWAWIDDLSDRLEAAHYAIGTADIPAAGVGAPHIRQRCFFGAVDLRFAAGGLGDGGVARPQGQRGHGDRGGEPGRDRAEPDGSARTAGVSGGMGDARRAGDERGSRSCKASGAPGPARGEAPERERCGPADRADGASGGLADNPRQRRHGGCDTAWQRRRAGVEADGSAGGLADTRCQQRERGQGAAQGREHVGPDAGWIEGHDGPVGICEAGDGPRGPGQTNGFWSSADWLLCRDGKWRPVVASHVGLVNGLPGSLGPSCDYSCGDDQEKEAANGPSSETDPSEVLQELWKADGTSEDRRQNRRTGNVCETHLLQPRLHGGGHGEGSLPEPEPQPGKGEQAHQGSVRSLRRDGETACPSQGRGSFQQRPVELEDVVSALPSSLALAELHGRRRDAEALRALCAAICEIGAVPYAPDQAAKVWRSISREGQDRIRLGFGHQWASYSFSPLSQGEPGRVMRLRGYGNAIVPQAAAHFIRAFIRAFVESLQEPNESLGVADPADPFEDLLG